MMSNICRALLLLLAVSGSAAAQDPLGWNSPRAVELVIRARARRELPRGDSTLHNYRAKANGYVYFYLDRRETQERTLVKVDQIALDLFWKRPNLTKQHIVGMRDVSPLPNKMYYHLDHLTVVQNGFGNVIKIGDGDEVRDVPHPAAPGAEAIYDYRLADSVTLQMGGSSPEVRVYEIQVRPKRTDRAALIGSMYVDRNSADIVRMTFTFTPASYVDKRLDYINISLDNGLFGGQYWLPNEQSLEIRRQIPELDFAAGAVIKGRMHISQYVFNEPIADSIFYGRPVSAAPEAERKAYKFPEDIYAGLATEGLAPPPQMEDLRARAAALVRENHLSGLPPARLYIPNASSVLRHDDAEGWYGGLGAAYVPSPTLRFDGLAGYAFGARKPELGIRLQSTSSDAVLNINAYQNRPRDVGPVMAMPGALNTLTSGFGDTDYTDIFLTRGASLDISGTATWSPVVSLRFEQQRRAMTDSLYRTRSGIENGNALEASLGVLRRMPQRTLVGWSADLTGSLVTFAPADRRDERNANVFVRALANAQLMASTENKRTSLIAELNAGVNSAADTPPQYDFLMGGRETLPGYDYRSYDVQQFAVTRATFSRTLFYPWIRGRVLGAAGYIGRDRTRPIPIIVTIPDALARSSMIPSTIYERKAHLRASYGAGVGLLWDVIHVDVVHGDHWVTMFSVRKDFWDML